TASAICEEKERRTLEYLLATDLHNREIVLSKFLSRLANMALLVITGLPILSLIQFLGGVDPEMVLAAFAATGALMVSLAAVSILASVHARKTRNAILLTYLAMGAYVAAGYGVRALLGYPTIARFALTAGSQPLRLGDVLDWLTAGNLPIILKD